MAILEDRGRNSGKKSRSGGRPVGSPGGVPYVPALPAPVDRAAIASALRERLSREALHERYWRVYSSAS